MTSNQPRVGSIEPADTTLTKIFVGGLPYHTSDDGLKQYFQQFGDIDEAVVITDRQTNKSRGYGFVTMGDRAAAERACKDPNPIIDGRKANVNLAYLGAKPRILPGRAFPAGIPIQVKTSGLYEAPANVLNSPTCPSAASTVFYPPAAPPASLVDTTSPANLIYMYDPVTGVYSILPGLAAADAATNCAYLYAAGTAAGLSVLSYGGGQSGRPTGVPAATGQYLTTLTSPHQPHYVQRLV